MRIAAGIFLIIVAIINLIAASGYLLGGAVVSGVDELSQAVQEEAAAQGQGLTPEQQAELAAVREEGPSGGGLMALGGFLAMLGILQIVGAVQAFRTKAAMLVMIVGGLSLLGEIWGAVVSSFGIMNILGFAAGILAILAGLSIKKIEEGGGPAPAAPPAA